MTPSKLFCGILGAFLAVACPMGTASAQAIAVAAQQNLPRSSSAVSKEVGTVKAISGNEITLTTSPGAEARVIVQDSTRILRAAPGEKDLKNAVPAQLQELQVGDRILARGKSTEDGKSLAAVSIIVMKGSEIAAKQQQEREDWQKRGVGGLVTAVDAKAGTITVSTSTFAGNKPIVAHVSKDAIVRRYAPDSVKFDDAMPGTLDQIKVGDQLRARGTRSTDGSELTAEEIVSGSFRNIAGTVVAADASANSIRVMDLATKKPITLKISGDSQLRTLPDMMAQRIARRMKAGTEEPPSATPSGKPPEVGAPTQSPGGSRNGRPPDFQQMLSRMSAVTLAELKTGAAVMIVATEGTADEPPTAITLLTGVEPILTASPSGQAAMLLSPWNLGGADAAAGGNP